MDLQKHPSLGTRAECGWLRRESHEGGTIAEIVGLQPSIEPQDSRGRRPPGRRDLAQRLRKHIAKRVKARQRRGEPALSVDTKKKEVLGNLKNPGKTYRRKRNPVAVNVHDFPDPELGKAIPYGVYDLNHNEAGVSVGITHDTAEFAVEAIRRWWYRLGKNRYRKPTADYSR